MKTNYKFSQFSRFCWGPWMRFLVKIREWLNLFNSVPLIKKTSLYHVYIRIRSSWLTFTVLQWMKTNFKISQFSRFLLRSEYAIQAKIWKWLKLLNSVPFIKRIKFTFEFDHLDWLSQFYSEWRKIRKN